MTEEPNQPTDPQDSASPGESDASFMAVFGRLGLAGWLALAWAFVPAVAGITLLTRMKPVSEKIIELAGQGGADLWKSVGVYVLGFVVLSGIGVLPTFAISVLGGYAFGPVVGFAAALAGFGGASVVGYFIARLIAREKVEQEIQRHEKARVVRNALVRSGFARTLLIVTLVRVPPNSPFALMNGTLATTGVRLPAYIIGTLAGMAPRTFAYVLIGQQVTDWSDARTPRWMIVAGIAVTIVVLMIVGSIANRALQRVTGETDEPDV
ncbi:MAG: VTT domain-containing protein [Planctomycetota bacterium]